MMKKIATIAAISSVALLGGCATGYTPVSAGLITNVKGPITATEHSGTSKTGTACASTIIGLVNTGDASIAAAKANGGIRTVSTVDFHTKGFYPFFGETCIIVKGD
jgi:hypothetical protein